jgi:hypothetical protein
VQFVAANCEKIPDEYGFRKTVMKLFSISS